MISPYGKRICARCKKEAAQLINEKTGQVHFILGGSRIRFVSGDISDVRTQEAYNQQHEEVLSD